MSQANDHNVSLVKAVAREFSQDECATMAASLAYYTIFSLAPFLVIVIAVASYFWDPETVESRVIREMTGVIGPAGVEQISTMLDAARHQKRGLWATIVGGAVLLFGATGVMIQLQAALNKVFNVAERAEQSGVWRLVLKRLLSFAMILVVAFLLLVSLVVSSVVSGIAHNLAGKGNVGGTGAAMLLIDLAVSLSVISALFTMIFQWMPDVRLHWKDSALAGVTTAILFLIGKFALGIYLGRQDPSPYGPAAALVLILIWVYYSGMILLLGAEFAQVWARRHGRSATSN